MRKVLTFAVVALAVVAACDSRRNTVAPEDAAAKFVADLGIKIQGKPNCSGIDSDGDGYVSCTVAIPPAKEGEPPKILSLDCAGVTSANGCDAQTNKYVVGCKEKQPKIAVPRQD